MEHSYLDHYSRDDSVLSRLDPRVSFGGAVFFIVGVVSLSPGMGRQLAAYAVTAMILTFISRVPLKVLFGRTLCAAPFVLLAGMSLIFYQKGQTVFTADIAGLTVTVTSRGLERFVFLVIKSFICMMTMITLISAIKFERILKSLEQLRVPRVIVMILSFMYRYVFLMEDELMSLKRAKRSRPRCPSSWENAKALANMLGSLFIRSYERSERVYAAMRARGFTGEVPLKENLPVPKKDRIVFAVFTIMIMLIRITGSVL